VGLQPDTPISAPPLPVLSVPQQQPVITLSSIYGGNSGSTFPQPDINNSSAPLALGYHGNQQAGTGYDATKSYTEGFRVVAPEIPAGEVDPQVIGMYQTNTGTLLAGIPNTFATTMSVSSAPASPVFPFVVSVGGNQLILPNGTYMAESGTELMQVTAITGTTWTVVRGYAGSTPTAHSSGASVNTVAEPVEVAVPQDDLTLTGA
jgi:hypothetical protein